ncbi:MAG TPA: type II secretion system F family protein [Elusimicrobiota bacterium]|nr:type II secretion system F family protein [Elusimicrobiota bacterium]
MPEITATLPEAIDLMALVMQAGSDFQIALAYYVEKGPSGPLRDELELVQSEIRTGMPRVEALRRLRDRIPEPSLQETARTIIHGIEMGASLVPLLRMQSRALRQRRAYQAEKRAAVAPLKLMFPLFVFIFPTLFVILFGPVIVHVLQGGAP